MYKFQQCQPISVKVLQTQKKQPISAEVVTNVQIIQTNIRTESESAKSQSENKTS